MKKIVIYLLIVSSCLLAKTRTTIDLNGTWQFDQTDTAFPPAKFTRTIPVPGLINLAEPKIDQYDKIFKRRSEPGYQQEHDVLNLQYDPKYNWYKKVIEIPTDLKDQQAMLTIKKSKYVTQIFVNGMDIGSSMECYTPIEFPITNALRFGKKNEILIRVGDRAWLPPQAAGSTDKEKINYIPGIWDDVEITFTGPIKIHKTLALPSASENKVTIKNQLYNFVPAQRFYGDSMQDTVKVIYSISEKVSGKTVIEPVSQTAFSKRDNVSEISFDIPFPQALLWTPDDPFLYKINIQIFDTKNNLLDETLKQFGMRDFGRDGKNFILNGERFYLRGTNITLHRFFEDPDCAALPWDREWVTRLLKDIPKQVGWNGMRICVGIAPDFWLDIADEAGLMIQNEWLYWQNHGWDKQLEEEYTDWVWSDGSHPSIIIWDAINENWDDYVGNTVIPKLKKLDPTRIWDAGYMTGGDMWLDEMDEPHPYMLPAWRDDIADWLAQDNYPLGDLHYTEARWHQQFASSAAQLANEYGWVWTWRNGTPALLTKKVYDYILGENATAEERLEMQAYWLQCQTENLRVNRMLAGIFAFCYLTNNYGFTGDWFLDPISELEPNPALKWFKHSFAPTGVYVDLVDQRYAGQNHQYKPGESLSFNLIGVTDKLNPVTGKIKLCLLDSKGTELSVQNLDVTIPPYENKHIPVTITFPENQDGFTVVAEFQQNETKEKIISRRFVKTGKNVKFYTLKPQSLN